METFGQRGYSLNCSNKNWYICIIFLLLSSSAIKKRYWNSTYRCASYGLINQNLRMNYQKELNYRSISLTNYIILISVINMSNLPNPISQTNVISLLNIMNIISLVNYINLKNLIKVFIIIYIVAKFSQFIHSVYSVCSLYSVLF